jgi:hypothetical protein
VTDRDATFTNSEVAASFWAAHESVRSKMQQALAMMQREGYRGFADVGWFWPTAPARPGDSEVRMTIVPVPDRDAPLPFSWARYEISDDQKIRVVARGAAD